MKADVEAIIALCGADMVLSHDGVRNTVRACLQEVHSGSQDQARRIYGPLGDIPKGTYLYLGPAEPAAQRGDWIRFGQKVLELRRAEPVMYGTETLYIRGICVEKGCEKTWGG